MPPSGSRKSTGNITRRQGNSTGSRAQRQATRAYSRKNSAGTDKRAAAVVGAFAEMLPGTYLIAGLTSSALANECCFFFFFDKLPEFKAMSTHRPNRPPPGLVAYFCWTHLLVRRPVVVYTLRRAFQLCGKAEHKNPWGFMFCSWSNFYFHHFTFFGSILSNLTWNG